MEGKFLRQCSQRELSAGSGGDDVVADELYMKMVILRGDEVVWRVVEVRWVVIVPRSFVSGEL